MKNRQFWIFLDRVFWALFGAYCTSSIVNRFYNGNLQTEAIVVLGVCLVQAIPQIKKYRSSGKASAAERVFHG